MTTVSMLDSIRMKNAYTISHGVVSIFVKSKTHGDKVVYCSQRDFDLISQRTWRISQKGRKLYASTDIQRHEKRSSTDMHNLIMQPGEGFG